MSGLFVFWAVAHFLSCSFLLHCEHSGIVLTHRSGTCHCLDPSTEHLHTLHDKALKHKQFVTHLRSAAAPLSCRPRPEVASLTLRPVAEDGDVGGSVLHDVQPVHTGGEAQVPVLDDLDSSLQNLCRWHTNINSQRQLRAQARARPRLFPSASATDSLLHHTQTPHSSPPTDS